jgi:hypothetical protein
MRESNAHRLFPHRGECHTVEELFVLAVLAEAAYWSHPVETGWSGGIMADAELLGAQNFTFPILRGVAAQHAALLSLGADIAVAKGHLDGKGDADGTAPPLAWAPPPTAAGRAALLHTELADAIELGGEGVPRVRQLLDQLQQEAMLSSVAEEPTFWCNSVGMAEGPCWRNKALPNAHCYSHSDWTELLNGMLAIAGKSDGRNWSVENCTVVGMDKPSRAGPPCPGAGAGGNMFDREYMVATLCALPSPSSKKATETKLCSEVFSIRGTTSCTDGIADSNPDAKHGMTAEVHWAGSSGRVHRQFSSQQSLYELGDPIPKEPQLQEANSKPGSTQWHVEQFVQANANRSIIFLGHSLGGALGAIAAFDAATRLNHTAGVGLFQFNAPRSGNAEIRDAWLEAPLWGRQDFMSLLRVRTDLVSTYPPVTWGHTGHKPAHNGFIYNIIASSQGGQFLPRSMCTIFGNDTNPKWATARDEQLLDEEIGREYYKDIVHACRSNPLGCMASLKSMPASALAAHGFLFQRASQPVPVGEWPSPADFPFFDITTHDTCSFPPLTGIDYLRQFQDVAEAYGWVAIAIVAAAAVLGVLVITCICRMDSVMHCFARCFTKRLRTKKARLSSTPEAGMTRVEQRPKKITF